MGDLSLQELVDSYCQEPVEGLRNSIISKSMPLLRSIVGKIRKPDNPLTRQEDLESAGISGLLQALDSYDCSKKIQFNTYAYYRIRGSIIDYLRKVDQIPRIQRNQYGKAQEIIDQLTQKYGRSPEDEEVAEQLNIPVEEYHQLLSTVQQRNALSLDSQILDQDSTLYDRLEDPQSESPDNRIEKDPRVEKLQQQIARMEERDRLVLTLYYYEDMTLSEIAVLLGRSEARISQIVGKLLVQLKNDLMVGDSFETGG